MSVVSHGRARGRPPRLLPRRAVGLFPCLLALTLAAGCAKTKVSDREVLVTGQLPRPGMVWVYDFAATNGDLPPDSVLAGKLDEHPKPQTQEEISEGRLLGSEMAAELVTAIQNMGLAAARPPAGTKPDVNDLVIRGYIVSIHEGSEFKRVAIGFGAGASEVKTVVEGFQMTPAGLRKLGSGMLDSGGSKTPGAALGALTFLATTNPAGLIISGGIKIYDEASGKSTVEGRAKATLKEIVKVLKQRFKDQGWIVDD